MFPGSQPFFRFSGADQGFRQEGADDGFLGFRKIFGVQAFLKMLAGFQGQAVFQGFQTLLVFFIFQEGLPVLREGSLRRRCCRGCRGSAPHGEQKSRAGRKNGKGKTGTEEGVHHRRIMIQAP